MDLSKKEQIIKHLNEYCYYFIVNFEEQIKYLRHLLEENPDLKEKPNSVGVSILAGLTSIIPEVGKTIGCGIIKGEKFINNYIDKNEASSVSSIAYSSNDDKDLFRKILISGAIEIFIHYECQFTKVTCKNGGTTRAMQKLGQDSAYRLLMYLLKTKPNILEIETVQKGILYGESKRQNPKFTKLGRTLHLIEHEIKLTTLDFFTNCGIENENIYYKKKNSISELNHRKIFNFETLDDKIYEKENCNSYNYILNEEIKEDLLKNTLEYITKKDPSEHIKQILINIQSCYNELLEKVESVSEERKNCNETKTDFIEISITNQLDNILTQINNQLTFETSKVLERTNEIKKDLDVVKRKQDEQKSLIVHYLEPIKQHSERIKNYFEKNGGKILEETVSLVVDVVNLKQSVGGKISIPTDMETIKKQTERIKNNLGKEGGKIKDGTTRLVVSGVNGVSEKAKEVNQGLINVKQKAQEQISNPKLEPVKQQTQRFKEGGKKVLKSLSFRR